MRRRTKMGIKNTASEERVFRLQWLPEDDTLIIERTGVSFGALVFEPSLRQQGRFLLIKLLYNVKDPVLLRGL